MIKVLLADRLAGSAVQLLEELGATVHNQPELTAEDLVDAIADHEVLVVRSTRVEAATLQHGENLSLVIRAGAGVNTIDVATASALGIHVANCPGKNAAAVAELAVGLLIAADRQIVNGCSDLRSGQWRKKFYGNARGLKGRTFGILGFGSIGKAVARAALALDMQVRVWSRSLTEEVAHDFGVQRANSPLEIANSDAVSVHLALHEQTRHIVNAEFLGAMPDGAILINTSRGPLVDTAALRDAVQKKSLRVGVDVYEDEPAGGEAPFPDTTLAKAITCTPHIGASTAQTSEAIAAEVVRIIDEFVKTGAVPNSVNLCHQSSATHTMLVRHYNRVGVLASVLDALREAQINVEEMENTIFEGAAAAVCTLSLDDCPHDALLQQLREHESILQILLNDI